MNKLFKKARNHLDRENLPVHIAIIMDGNGRWAKRRGLPRNIGHREGSNNLRKIVESCDKIGIKYLTVYAFSTENWKRPKSEVETLMSLLLEYLKNADRELAGKNVRIRVLGDIKGLPVEIQQEIVRVTQSTRKNSGLNLNIALNYGSRGEIVQGVRKIINDVAMGKLKVEEVTEKTISDSLYTSGLPDPDLVIRTSGEQRISNFLLWQIAYSEFWYTDVMWPDFKESHLIEAIRVYQKRNRRFGGI